MKQKDIEKKAVELQQRVGGTIFAFPIDETDPLSKYAVVVYAGGSYHVYPKAENISLAAQGVLTILEEFKKTVRIGITRKTLDW